MTRIQALTYHPLDPLIDHLKPEIEQLVYSAD